MILKLKSILIIMLFFSCANNLIIENSNEKKNLIDDFNVSSETAQKFSEAPIIIDSPKKSIQSELIDKSPPSQQKVVNINRPVEKKEEDLKALSMEEAKKQGESSGDPEQKKRVTDSKDKKLVEMKIKSIALPQTYPENIPPILVEFDKRAVPVWEKFTPNVYRNESYIFAIKYFGINCGTIEIRSLGPVKIGKKRAFHFYGKALSADFYEYFYKLDDYVESFVDIADFTPIKYTLVQRESGQSVDDLQLFDIEKLTTSFWYKKIKQEQIRKIEEVKFVPRYVVDSFSVLYFIRGLPLDEGKIYEIPVVTRSETWLLTINVEEKSQVVIEGEKVAAIKIKAETHFPGVLKKRGDIFFWFSDDEAKRPLKFEGKVKIGSIEGVLVKSQHGEKISQEEINN